MLVVSAHPDDETICLGGTMAMYAHRGTEITILCTTRGEGGSCGDPPICTQAQLGAVREQEMRCAARVLGVGRVEFLDYVDPPPAPGNVLRPAAPDMSGFRTRLVEVLRLLRPQVVVTHGSNGEYGHPQHVATNRAMTEAFFLAGKRDINTGLDLPPHQPAKLYYFAAAAPPALRFSHFANMDDPPTLAFDISAYLAIKHQAFACHYTQIATTLRDAGLAQAQGIFPSVEYLHRRFPRPGEAEGDLFEGIIPKAP
jgi:mycothiol S-conjugate amidase